MISCSHSSLGLTLDQVRALVCAHRSLMMLTRSMLHMCGVKNVVTFDNPIHALNHMLMHDVDLILADAATAPLTGLQLIKVIRHRTADPLCFLPIILTCSQPKPNYVNKAMRMGAQLILSRPFSTSMLRNRLNWILNDQRGLYLEGDRWKIDGVEEQLQQNLKNKLLPSLLTQLRLGSVRKAMAEARAAQTLVDNILGTVIEDRRAGFA